MSENTQISENFTLANAEFSSTAVRYGIDNAAPLSLQDNIRDAAGGMEEVIELLGYIPHVDSWYRCPKLNSVVGGAKNSAHMEGFAVDFVCPEFGTPIQIVEALEHSGITFDQLIQEGRWVHISFAPALRRQVLVAEFHEGKPTTYTKGA